MPYTPTNPIAQPEQYAPLTLAILGDSIYDLYVRTRLLETGSLPVNTIHKLAVGYVKAAAQARSVHAISDKLTEAETSVFKRGRNTHAATVPKNASVSDYRAATGFEALLGYLYISGASARLDEILRLAFEAAQKA